MNVRPLALSDTVNQKTGSKIPRIKLEIITEDSLMEDSLREEAVRKLSNVKNDLISTGVYGLDHVFMTT